MTHSLERVRSRSRHRILTALVSLSLIAAGLTITAAPVAAVHAVPWRFLNLEVFDTVLGNSPKSWALQCPGGYTPVAGGVVDGTNTGSVRRQLEYPNPFAGTFHVAVWNSSLNNTTIRVTATCVWLDDVGAISTVLAEFSRNGSGRAGGTVFCPEGTTVLSGGVDWNSTSTSRRIDFSAPVGDANGQGGGWYVAGYSNISGDKLNIELRCVAASLLTGEYIEADDSVDSSPANTKATAVCTFGYRLLTGGVLPTAPNPLAEQGYSSRSGPLDARQWRGQGLQESGVTLRALALCVPASTVSLLYTQTPAALSTARSGTILFTATDSAGENVSVSCNLNGSYQSCPGGNSFTYGPLPDGIVTFFVLAKNQSGFEQGFSYNWTIDATEPVMSSHTGATSIGLTGPFGVTFSEPVNGVTTSSMVVHANAANVDLIGTVARPSPTTATWTPKTRLVPGETYRVSLSSAIHDVAGNALTATFYTVRTIRTVDSTSAAFQRYWDVDPQTVASGGSYIVSRLPGSRAELTFTATAGQTVSVYGIRQPNGGYADIYLDGVKQGTPSFYAATTARARVYLSAALTGGTHTVSIRPLGTRPAGSSGSWVAVDNLAFGATVKQESALTQTFRRIGSTSAFDGSYDLVDQASGTETSRARFQLTFVGTGLKVYATKTSTSGAAKVYVDGVLKATISLNAASTAYKALVYSVTLPLGQHSVRLEAAGTSSGANSSINVDRITID